MVLALLLTGLAVFIAAVFVTLAVVTVGIAVRRRRRDRQRTEVRSQIRRELFERRDSDDPRWKEWTTGLSTAEREELAAVLERYLRTVAGSEARFFRSLAETLEMGVEADRTLDRDTVIPRQRALARLTVLDYPLTEARLLETCLDDPQVREATARLLAQRRDEFEKPRELGTAMLIWDGQEPLTAEGLQTLYDLNDGNPLPLLSQGFWSGHQWQPTVLAQVCTVLGHCHGTVRAERFEWVFERFDHDSPVVRAAAIRVFRGTGWRGDVRERLPFRQLVTDEDPRVRRATYEVLTYWGDDRARELLEWAVIDEDDPRTQLIAVRGLVSMEADPLRDQPGWPTESWDWVRAELEAGQRGAMPDYVKRGIVA